VWGRWHIRRQVVEVRDNHLDVTGGRRLRWLQLGFHHGLWRSRRQRSSLLSGYGQQSRPCGRAYSDDHTWGALKPGKHALLRGWRGRFEQTIVGLAVSCGWGIVLNTVVWVSRPVARHLGEVWKSEFGNFEVDRQDRELEHFSKSLMMG
jgi:hypothetical protein